MAFFLRGTVGHSIDRAKQCVFKVPAFVEHVPVALPYQAFNHRFMDGVGLLEQPAHGGAGLVGGQWF
ncbi:hypothetical protein [Pseudomonas sp. R4-34-07]|uniref:hypothetical protein n=1 Tax=Pseudomonas sp. R4-34-07 TaxID=658642 RepID=UPI000F55D7BF|nr:hypothetical protein [Pseudomonas sp. R4-34-07]